MKASKLVPVYMLIFLAGCGVTPTRAPEQSPAMTREPRAATPSATLEALNSTPTSLSPGFPTDQYAQVANGQKYEVITKDNISRLALLHEWNVDGVRSSLWQVDRRLWFDDSSLFFINVENYGNIGIQTYKITDFSVGWFAFTDYSNVTLGEDNHILAYQWGITIIDEQGKVMRQIYEDNICSEYSASQMIAVPNSNLVITGHQEDKEFTEGYGTSRIRIWDIDKNTCNELLEFPGLIESMDVDGNGHYLSYSVIRSAYDSAKEDYKIWIETIIYDLHLDDEVCSMEDVGDVLFTRQNQLMVFQRSDYTYLILDPDNCSIINQVSLDIDTYQNIRIPNFTISPDGKLLVVTAAGKIQFIDINNGELIHEVAVNLIGDKPIQIVDFSPDGRFLVGARDKYHEDMKGHIMLFGVVENK